MELGTIFTLNEYDEAYKFVEEKGYTIEEIEPKGGERQFKIVEIPVYEPTNEEITQQRQQAYVERTDPLTLRKLRKQALGEWTEEDEAQYVAEIQVISQQIAEEYPYRDE
jgi:hypothetical protein